MENTKKIVCQCPISGVSHFYVPKKNVVMRNVVACQCPISGVSHFYELTYSVAGNTITVSMPYIGRFSFLLAVPSDYNWYSMQGVNALYRAFLISTKKMAIFGGNKSVVSMPYIGRFSFLQYPFKNPVKSMASGTVFRG